MVPFLVIRDPEVRWIGDLQGISRRYQYIRSYSLIAFGMVSALLSRQT